MENISDADRQALQVKAYLSRKRRENGNERLRLAKAIQWYFFYGAMLTVGLFLIHYYPGVLNIFSSVNSYIVVIVFYVLMYGLTFVAYTTTAWPYPKMFEKSTAIKAMNWSPQLCWVERIMTVTYYTFFALGQLSRYMADDKIGAVVLACLQLPHVVTCILGFPTNKGLQVIGIFFRVLGLLLSFVHLQFSFIAFDRMQTVAILGVLGALPFALVFGMFFNGRLPKNRTTFLFGETQRRDLVILFISGFAFALWEGLLAFIFFYYTTPAWTFFTAWRPLTHDYATIVDFIDSCIITCMAILAIPCMYHCILDINLTYPGPQPVQLQNSESIALISQVELNLPNSAPRDFMNDIALVIACHKSKDNIIKTLHAAHHDAHFPLNNIYIAHNANASKPIDTTGPVVWDSEEYRDCHYVYIPAGNKSIAMNYVIENYIKPAGITQVIMIDDDVLFPPDIDLRGGYESIMNDKKVKAVAFTIRGLEDATFWQKFQHMEYMQAGLLKLFQGQFGSVLTCHGAIALWDVQACIDVFALHNTEFHGEDLQMGLILRKMNQEYRIEANAVGPVATASPKSLLYETDANEKSLFSQRVFSWDMAAHHFFLDFMHLTFVNWERCGLILKPFLIVELWTMLQDWLRFLFLVNIFQQNPVTAFSLVGTLVILQMVVVIIFDRMVLSHRPELQSPTYICLIYPFYNILTVLFRFVGLLYNALVYTPWNPPRILIKDRKKMGMIPPHVILPWGTTEERTQYWDTVWQPNKKAILPPPVLDEAEQAAVASVARVVLAAGGASTPRSQGEAPVARPNPDPMRSSSEAASSPRLVRPNPNPLRSEAETPRSPRSQREPDTIRAPPLRLDSRRGVNFVPPLPVPTSTSTVVVDMPKEAPLSSDSHCEETGQPIDEYLRRERAVSFSDIDTPDGAEPSFHSLPYSKKEISREDSERTRKRVTWKDSGLSMGSFVSALQYIRNQKGAEGIEGMEGIEGV